MIVVGGTEIPTVEEVSEERLTAILDEIIMFARSNPQEPERETFDFKRELNISKKPEIRKDFSSFANTRGGLIIVGVDEQRDYQLINPKIPRGEQLSQILSTDSYICPPVKFSSRTIAYQGKTVLLYDIPESHVPIEVKSNAQWVAYGRINNTTKILSTVELMLKFYRGVKKLPEDAQMSIPQLGFYHSKDDSREPFIKWTIKNKEELYKQLKLMLRPLIPIPLPIIPFQYHPELYYSYTGWYGDYGRLLDVIDSIENKLQELGISFEVWTVPLGGARTYSEDHHYISGCGAQNLKTCLEEVHKKQQVTRFVWILFSPGPVIEIVIGELYKNHCDIKVLSVFHFIPNNFPFISIDDAGRVILEPLPAYKMEWWTKDCVTEGGLPIKVEWREDLSDDLLAPLLSAQIKGYFGDKPRPRSYDLPFRTRGLTLLEVTSPSDKFPRNCHPLITNVAPIFCHISSAPRGLNDKNGVKIGGMKLSTLSFSQYPIHDLTLVLFSIDCYVNQSQSYKMVMKNE
ncbi:ATP-binding protein [candidate division WOR-3 bacterium]|jgi:hypothetical protein|nr:ATP-binding protein [candidate division WOR-3 bacterium]